MFFSGALSKRNKKQPTGNEKSAKKLKQPTLNFFTNESNNAVASTSTNIPTAEVSDVDMIEVNDEIHESVATPAENFGNEQTNSQENEFQIKFNQYIHSFHKIQKDGQRRFVYCKICNQYPDIVRRYCENKRLPPIIEKEGIRFKKQYIMSHFESIYHKKCKEAEILSTSNVHDTEIKGQMDKHITESNKARANHIGKLLLQVYTDAKKLTLSAYSWPSRFVASEAGQNFNFNSSETKTIPRNLNVQYVNPSSHLDFLKTIVKSDVDLKKKIETSLACSLHIDGSVDRTQIDKIYILLKVVTSCGDMETIFLGIGQQRKRGAIGLMDASKNGIIENCGEEIYENIMCFISSFCTDGAPVNIGDKGGLWKLFDDEVKKYRSSAVPFFKLWCSAHRMDLVWGDLTDSVPEVDKVLNVLSSIASFFHNSSIRSEELKQIAREKRLTLLSIAKIFEIRWTEWTHGTVENILRSWNALMAYFQNNKGVDAQCKGFYAFLSKINNLRLISFLADLLSIYQRFHKNVQSDSLTIVTLAQYISRLDQALTKFKDCKLVGGWEEELETNTTVTDGKIFLKEIELETSSTRSGHYDFENNRGAITTILIDCLHKRFQSDVDLYSIIDPFIHFQDTADIRKIHELFAEDFSLRTLSLQFDELVQLKINENDDLAKTVKYLLNLDNSENYNIVIAVLCRIQACSPQTADVERAIKANNLLKTAFRSSLSLDTENKYMYIHFNMPPLEHWDPRSAIISWLNQKDRRHHQNLLQKETCTKSPWFKEIFEEVIKESENEQLDDIVELNNTKIKF